MFSHIEDEQNLLAGIEAGALSSWASNRDLSCWSVEVGSEIRQGGEGSVYKERKVYVKGENPCLVFFGEKLNFFWVGSARVKAS